MHHQTDLFRHIKGKLIYFVCKTLGGEKKVILAEVVKIHFHEKFIFYFRALNNLKQMWTNTRSRLPDEVNTLKPADTQADLHFYVENSGKY